MSGTILSRIQRGKLPQGYELKASDVGALLSAKTGRARVGAEDVGKQVFARSRGLYVEPAEMRDRRKGTSAVVTGEETEPGVPQH